MGLLWDILNNIRPNLFIKHINTQLKEWSCLPVLGKGASMNYHSA